MAVFMGVTPQSLVDIRHFGVTCLLCFQIKKISSETFLYLDQTTKCRLPEDSRLLFIVTSVRTFNLKSINVQ